MFGFIPLLFAVLPGVFSGWELYDDQIHRGITSKIGLVGNEPAKIPEICENLASQIADRNSRVKLSKLNR